MQGQLEQLRVPHAVFEAVHGASLSPAALAAAYDRDKAVRLFNRELSKGEIGCALSHVGIYRKMVDEGIPHALILEDDADILDPDLGSTLAKLAQCYPAEQPVAVLMNHAKRYDANKKLQLDDGRVVYDAYRGCCAHGYFITRAAAEQLVRRLYPVYVVADKWEYFQERYIDVKALVPYAIGLTSASLDSSIEAMGVREKKLANSGNYTYYIRRWASQLAYSIKSRPFIRVVHQEKSALDRS